MIYPVYLFDFDYTLANSEKGIITCFHLTMEKHGYAPVDDDTIRHTIGMPMEDAISRITGETDSARIRWFQSEYRKFSDTLMTPNTFFYPETVPTLTRLREQDARIGIISTKTRGRIAEKFEQDHVLHLLDFIIGREDVKNPKPDPEPILLAIGRLGVQKKDVLYTGDSLFDAGAAQNAGVDFAAVTTGTTKAEAFESFPHKKIMKNLAELL